MGGITEGIRNREPKQEAKEKEKEGITKTGRCLSYIPTFFFHQQLGNSLATVVRDHHWSGAIHATSTVQYNTVLYSAALHHRHSHPFTEEKRGGRPLGHLRRT